MGYQLPDIKIRDISLPWAPIICMGMRAARQTPNAWRTKTKNICIFPLPVGCHKQTSKRPLSAQICSTRRRRQRWEGNTSSSGRGRLRMLPLRWIPVLHIILRPAQKQDPGLLRKHPGLDPWTMNVLIYKYGNLSKGRKAIWLLLYFQYTL